MNENQYDQLQQELAEFRPSPPSQRLRLRIAQQLDIVPEPRSMRRSVVALRAAIAILAMLMTGLLLMSGDSVSRLDTSGSSISQAVTLFDPNAPSLWSYHQATVRSVDALDSLLSQHAAHGDQPSDDGSQFFFTRRHEEFNSYSGEL